MHKGLQIAFQYPSIHVRELWQGNLTILCSQNRLSELYQALIRTLQTCVCQEINLKHAVLYGFSYGIASTSVRRSRLAKAVVVQKWSWKYDEDSYMNAFDKPHSSLSHASKHWQHTPQTDCLAALNGVCTKETQSGLGYCCWKTKPIITHGQAHLSTLQAWLLFIPGFCFYRELCLWKNNMNMNMKVNMNKMANFSFE